MVRTIVSLLVAVASGLILLAATSALELFNPALRIVLACGLGVVVALIAIFIAGRTRQVTKRETAANLRSGGNVNIQGVHVKGSTGLDGNSSTASNIRAKGGITIGDVEEDAP